jgi:hypothetical protein
MARGGARPGAGRPARKSAQHFPPLGARARAREVAGNQRPWPADKVERWAIDRLIPYAKNARTHTDAQVAAIASSIMPNTSPLSARSAAGRAGGPSKSPLATAPPGAVGCRRLDGR